ncbi:putative transcription factor bHLH041 [Curcuma longa]|uniref:putative transcription factor bHLH041 n=1 Tax=Curcuma longa TaxID=136217 RepID=UPI003D9F482E
MDSFFLLGAEARRRFLQIAGRLLGCTYICSWSPLRQPATTHLVSKEGWHCAEDSGQSSSSAASVSLRLFEAYRRSLCDVHSSSIPGLAYKDGLPYIQLTDPDIVNLAFNHSQRQFYQEAGVKTAVFMGCRHGEIELGIKMPTNPTVNLQMNIQQVFSEEFIRQSVGSDLNQPLLGDLVTLPSEPGQLSSSSSSLPSISVGSPSDTSPRLLAQPSPPFIMQPFNFSAPRTAEDEALTRAMLAVITSSKDMPSPLLLNQQTSNPIGAFRPYYNNPLTPEAELEPNWHGQRMIKIGLHMLRRISVMKAQLAAPRAQEYQQPTRSHSHHVISERKRREKLNEQFNALKALLPLEPKIKKDKATLLVNTKNYLNLLKTQIKELEERNRVLEIQVQVPRNDEVDVLIADSDERIQIQVIRLPESTSEAQQIDLRVVVKEECDMIDWVIRVLECLKEMTGLTLVSMETRTVSSQNNRFGAGSFRLQIQASSDWDEATFKEAVSNAVANVLARVSDQAHQT